MSLVLAICGFFAGYVFALTRKAWQDWGRASATAARLRSERWNGMKSTVIVGAIFFFLLYVYVVRKA